MLSRKSAVAAVIVVCHGRCLYLFGICPLVLVSPLPITFIICSCSSSPERRKLLQQNLEDTPALHQQHSDTADARRAIVEEKVKNAQLIHEDHERQTEVRREQRKEMENEFEKAAKAFREKQEHSKAELREVRSSTSGRRSCSSSFVTPQIIVKVTLAELQPSTWKVHQVPCSAPVLC